MKLLVSVATIVALRECTWSPWKPFSALPSAQRTRSSPGAAAARAGVRSSLRAAALRDYGATVPLYRRKGRGHQRPVESQRGTGPAHGSAALHHKLCGIIARTNCTASTPTHDALCGGVRQFRDLLHSGCWLKVVLEVVCGVGGRVED